MLSLAFLIIIFSSSFARDLYSSSSEEFTSEYVLNLNPDEFYKLLETNRDEIIFTRFYLPSCPACIEFHEKWHKVAKALKGVCKVVDFNCEKDPNTCWYAGVESFPEFVVFKNRKVVSLYGDSDYGVRALIWFIKDKGYLEEEYRRRGKRDWDMSA